EFVVYGCAKMSKKVFASGTMRPDAPAQRFSIDVSDCQYLILGTRPLNDGDASAIVNWANPQLIAKGTSIDKTPPSPPTNVKIVETGSDSATFSWSPSSDNVGVNTYIACLDGTPCGASYTTTISISGLIPKTSHTLTVKAMDLLNNSSAGSAPLSFTTRDGVRTTYLSDLKWVKANIGYGGVVNNRSVMGGEIKVGGNTYSKGIGVHAITDVTYKLDKVYNRFRAVVGVQDTASSGSVEFEVHGDGKKLASSGVLVCGVAKELDVDISGVTELKIRATDGGDGINSDHADWADARVLAIPANWEESKKMKADAKRSVPLSSLDLRLLGQGYGQPGLNRAMEGGLMQMNGVRFEHGVAVHAESSFTVALDGKAVCFHALCGVDDDSLTGPASVTFHVLGDGKILWSSKLMKPGMPAVRADVPLKGVRVLVLKVDDGGDGIRSDHADWAEAAIDYDGETPVATFNRPLETPLKKMVAFTLELYYMKDSDKKFAEEEAKRMIALLGKIAPHIELDIKVVKATAPFRSKFESNGWHDVPNHQPSDKCFQSLLITEEDIGAAGWAGPVMGCLSKQRLQDKLARGGDSADISLHEWMHTICGQKINGREIGWLHANPQFGFSDPDYLDKCGDGIWHKWYAFLLRWK
ncbi:MAG: NPCBM/NEW2 domain-containing protein, partial [bacterium]